MIRYKNFRREHFWVVKDMPISVYSGRGNEEEEEVVGTEKMKELGSWGIQRSISIHAEVS